MMDEKRSPFKGHRGLVAILRGVRPDEVVEIGKAILSAGITLIEVPLNSPEPLESIRNLRMSLGDNAVVGAGTVLTVEEVEAVHEVGGVLVVSPNMRVDVIRRSANLGMISCPGVLTPTEAFDALTAGADALKLFPASLVGPGGLAAMRAVLPSEVPVLAVGGVDEKTLADWINAGCNGFGIGSNIYKAGFSAEEVSDRAVSLVAAYDKALA